jgi:hypothetical protein
MERTSSIVSSSEFSPMRGEGWKRGFILDRAYGIKVYSFCKGSSLSVPRRGRKIVRTTCGSRFRSFTHATRKQDLRFESLGFGAKVFFVFGEQQVQSGGMYEIMAYKDH